MRSLVLMALGLLLVGLAFIGPVLYLLHYYGPPR